MKPRHLVIPVLLAGFAWLAWAKLPVFQKKSAAGAEAPRAVPVTTTVVEVRDVPIWRTGLGTVQAFNSVTVRPRVSGLLDEVNFTEGQEVREGDVLAKIDPRPYEAMLAQAQGKVAQSAAQLGNARDQLKRVTELVKSGAESRQKFDQLSATVAQYEAQQQADEAAVVAARLDLDFTTVRAPISGRTGIRRIDKGNLVTANQGEGLVTISQFQPISVVFTLPQRELPAVRRRLAKDATPLQARVLSDDNSVLGTGTLELIDNQIDASTGTLRLKATFANQDRALWPGQFVTGEVLVDTLAKAVVVPTPVISAGLNGPFAYVVNADHKVEARNVTTGPQVGSVTVIEKGLAVGETVVLDGQVKLKPGAAVAVQNAQPAKP